VLAWPRESKRRVWPRTLWIVVTAVGVDVMLAPVLPTRVAEADALAVVVDLCRASAPSACVFVQPAHAFTSNIVVVIMVTAAVAIYIYIMTTAARRVLLAAHVAKGHSTRAYHVVATVRPLNPQLARRAALSRLLQEL
jgi:hypothetical protein